MWQTFIYGMHWKHEGKMYYDELSAESQDEAAGYFIDHCRDDVSLVRVELVGPDDGGVRSMRIHPSRLLTRCARTAQWIRMKMPDEKGLSSPPQ